MSDVKFRIQGEDYPIPRFDNLTLSEAVVINQVTGLPLADAAAQSNETILVGLAAVALKRANPSWPIARVIETVDKLGAMDVEIVGGGEAAEPVPPQNEPDTNSASGDNSEQSD